MNQNNSPSHYTSQENFNIGSNKRESETSSMVNINEHVFTSAAGTGAPPEDQPRQSSNPRQIAIRLEVVDKHNQSHDVIGSPSNQQQQSPMSRRSGILKKKFSESNARSASFESSPNKLRTSYTASENYPQTQRNVSFLAEQVEASGEESQKNQFKTKDMKQLAIEADTINND